MVNLFPSNYHALQTMIFVDGENLAIRYGQVLKERKLAPLKSIKWKPEVFVWTDSFTSACDHEARTVRKYYYTSVQGTDFDIHAVVDQLKLLQVEQPSVFKMEKNRCSKQVDISLTTDMLHHAFRHNYETAVLVAGDADYIPLVNAVKAEGRRVLIWFLSNGLSPTLKRVADYFVNIDPYLFGADEVKSWTNLDSKTALQQRRQ